MTNLVTVLWCVFLIVVGVVLFYYSRHKGSRYSFQNYNTVDIPYISLDIQGVLLNMIVDSGGAVSIITENALHQLSYEESKRQVNLNAITGENVPSKMVTIPVNISGKEVKEDFVVHPVSDFGGFEVMYGITIHGLLGNEFFEKTGCKIDYKKHTVTLK